VTPHEIWNAAKHQLELQLDRGSYETWVKRAEYIDFSQDEKLFIVGVPTSYIRDMLQNRLYRNVKRIVSNVAGSSVEVRFDVVKETRPMSLLTEPDDMPLFKYATPQEPVSDAPSVEEILRQPRLDSLPDAELNPRYTFERFVVNKSNQMVYQAACAVAEYPGTTYNPFLIYGGVGLGKTHILQAIGHECAKRGRKVLYISSEVFTSELMTAIRNRTTAMFQQKYRTVDVLLVDDIQFIAGKESTQEEFFHTFNALVNFNKQIVMASDRHPRDMSLLDERLRSRFQGGLVADVQTPEYETRRLILQMWAQEKNVALPKDVLELLSTRAPQSVRELEGVFNQILAQIRLNNGDVPLQRAEATVTRFVAPRERISLMRIVEVTSQKLGVSVAEITGKKRTEAINEARQIAMYLARELTDFSLPQIADVFGGRSHTTVLHGCNKIAEDLPNNLLLKARVEKIKKAILS
jgi:chromosomal replication initiator protein